jgi:hypothetical protein
MMLPAVQIEACTSRIRNQLVATFHESCVSEIVAADQLCAVLGHLHAKEKATPLKKKTETKLHGLSPRANYTD